jgi:hypothetical protein
MLAIWSGFFGWFFGSTRGFSFSALPISEPAGSPASATRCRASSLFKYATVSLSPSSTAAVTTAPIRLLIAHSARS